MEEKNIMEFEIEERDLVIFLLGMIVGSILTGAALAMI